MTDASAMQSFVRGLAHFFFGGEGENVPLTAEELLALRQLPFLCRLTGEQEVRFFELCGTFLEKVPIEGTGGFRPTTEDRIKVAASCSLLYAGRPEWPFPPVRGAYVSPTKFCEDDYEPSAGGQWAGYYRHADDTVHCFEGDLRHSFTCDRDGYHLGLHEFAHALDAEEGTTNGELPHMVDSVKALFAPILEREMKKAGRRNAALRKYGATDMSEAFATAVECFFEQPLKMKTRAADLYVLLALYLNQNPAAYDERLMTDLAATVTPVVNDYLGELLDGADIREGKIFIHAPRHHRGKRYLHACYRTKHGKWSKHQFVDSYLMSEQLPHEPETELPVTLELRNGQIRRISAWGEFPPLLHKDMDELLATLQAKLLNTARELVRDAIRLAWRAYGSDA